MTVIKKENLKLDEIYRDAWDEYFSHVPIELIWWFGVFKCRKNLRTWTLKLRLSKSQIEVELKTNL